VDQSCADLFGKLGLQESVHFGDGVRRRIGIIFEPMPEHSPAVGKAWNIEGVIGAGIHDQLDGRALVRAAIRMRNTGRRLRMSSPRVVGGTGRKAI